MESYNEFSEDLSNVYLEDSWVLGLNENNNSIEFLVEFVLTEKHPLYQTPKPDEQYCYKKGKLTFPNISNIEWIQKNFQPTEDPDGSKSYGNIDSLVFEDGKYHVTGEWGEVVVVSGSPQVTFE